MSVLAYDYPFPDAPSQFPALPQTAVGTTIPQPPGWIVSRVNSSSNAFWVTDGNYQAMFIVTPTGVVVVDAPEPLPFFPALPVLDAVRRVTSLPITHLIYTHAHTDHIGGAGLIKAAFPKVEIIAQEETKRILERENDRRRPIPTRTFVDRTVLDIAGERIELSYFGPIHVEGNTFVYLPRQKILMVVDVIFPGWVPFKGLALSGNVADWTRAHDIILNFDFDTLVTGHLGRLGNRQDVTVAKEYIDDIKNFVEEAYLDQTTLFSAIGAIDGKQGGGFSFQPVAKWALFSGFFDFSVKRCADKLDAKWLGRLGGAESFNFSNCEAWFVARGLGTENWYPRK
jgi:glyoxylase-like metal-dependent hydrolase (beta-lactamase superfamily II)